MKTDHAISGRNGNPYVCTGNRNTWIFKGPFFQKCAKSFVFCEVKYRFDKMGGKVLEILRFFSKKIYGRTSPCPETSKITVRSAETAGKVLNGGKWNYDFPKTPTHCTVSQQKCHIQSSSYSRVVPR